MNQNPEQLARDKIDADLIRCGWVIQNKNQINLKAAIGIAIREYQTNVGPADYVLFVDAEATTIKLFFDIKKLNEQRQQEIMVYLNNNSHQIKQYKTNH